jgi:hypothetical protein
MASDDRPPKKLEAVTRRFSSYLQQELQLENLDDLKRLPEEFLDRARRSLELMFPPVAKQLEDEAAVARVAHEVASSLFSAPLLKSIEAKRISEIEGLGKRHKKDPELVATWIREGLSTDAVGALILAGYTNKLKPVSFPSSEQRDESDRAFLRQIGFRSAKPITTGAAADRKDEVDLSEKEQPEEKLDRKISAEAKATETETPAPQSERKNGDPRPQELAAQAAARTAEFEQWLAPELQRVADDAMSEAAKQEAGAAVTSEDPTADPSVQRIPEPKLTRQLQRGRECEERAQEIAKIRRMVHEGGLTIHEIRRDHPEFGIWELVGTMLKEDRDTFDKPIEWGAAKGYANNLLARFKGKSPSTIDDWRKFWRAHDQNRKPS